MGQILLRHFWCTKFWVQNPQLPQKNRACPRNLCATLLQEQRGLSQLQCCDYLLSGG